MEVSKMFNTIKTHLYNHALRKTRAELLKMSDRQLEDVGISRALLNKGVASWPWRENAIAETGLTTQPGRMKAQDINKAVRELSRMSDKDLRDIGISRGSIRHSVQHGIDGRSPDGPKRAA